MKAKNEKNEIKIGAILSYIIIILNMLIGILYTPILTSKLGQSEYGLYSLVSTVISYLTVLDFGFGNAIIIYTSKYIANKEKEKEEKLHGMFLIIYTIIGLIAGCIGVVLTFNVNRLFGNTMSSAELEKAKTLMSILTLNLIVTFPLSIFSSIITAYEKFIFAKILNIIRTILNPIIMIVLLNFGYKSIALVSLITILNITTLLINAIYCRKKLKIKLKFGKIDTILLKEIMAYSVWIFLNSIMDKINWNIDEFTLGIVSGTVAVAIYSVAGKLAQMYLNFSTAISGVLLPKVTQMEARNASDEEFSNVFIKTGRIQYLILAVIITGFVLFGQEFINIMWVGPEYSEAYLMTCILMIPLTIPLIQNVGLNIIQAKNQYKYRVKVLLVFAIFNLVISIVLAKFFDGTGAAIGTALSVIFGQIIFMNIFYYKKIHINIPKFWKEILKMSVPILVACLISFGIKIAIPANTSLKIILEICIYIIVYSIAVWKFAMNQYEKELVKKPLKRIGDKLK